MLVPLVAAVVLAEAPAKKYRDDTVLVKPKKGVPLAQLERVHKQLGAKVQHTVKGVGNLQIVKLPPGLSVEKAIARYQKSGKVEYAEPDYIVYALPVGTNEYCQAISPGTTDPHFQNGTLWGLHNYGQNGGTCGADIDAPEGWEIRTDAGDVLVAVIDTGIRYTHEDLAANMWTNPGEIPGNGIDDDGNGIVDDVYGARFINGVASGDPWDDHFHGTHVAGTIMAAGDNGAGIVGVAWSGKVMAVKFLNAGGSGTTSDAILSIDYARQMGAKVLNNSWGGGGFSQALLDAILATRDANMIFVAAAGNNGSDNDFGAFYPASYNSDNIVAVAATDRNDQRAGFSNFGANAVDLGAPGVDVFSCDHINDSSYRYASGTSMASPHVAGVCALLWAEYSSANYSQIITRLLRGVDYIDSMRGKTVTGGRLNLHRSIEDPVADFDFVITGLEPMTVTFTDRSLAWTSEIVSRQFDLGDGTITNASVVSHTYSAEGPFVAVLRVENAAGNYSTKVRKIEPYVPDTEMVVTPAEDYWVEGPYGGPFVPWKEYFIENHSLEELHFEVTSTVNWLRIEPSSGSVPPGWYASVAVEPTGPAFTFHPGIYGGALNFVNTDNGRGDAQRWVQLTVKAPGALVVTPTNVFESAGFQLGPFAPVSMVYTVQNVSANFTLEFSAVPNADWQTVEPQSGLLGPGQLAEVTVTINENANNLDAGTYIESVGFNNNTTGEYLGDRDTRLTVHSLLSVTPTGSFTSSGPVGGPFEPNTATYTIEWLGSTPVNWTAYSPDDWFTITPESGTLNPNQPQEVTVSYNSAANELPEGVWESGVTFTADQHNTYVNRFTQLIVGQGQLFVTPWGGFNASGPQGGPFSPASKTYRLTWVGVTDVQWAVNVGHGWLTATPSSGTLTNGGTVDVVVSFNAASLTPGSYQSSVAFVNTERNITYENFPVNLTVTQAGTLAVDPAEPVIREGPDGGPFASKTYTLRNPTAYSLNWSASSSESWIELLNTSGTLPPGGFANVVVQFDGEARSLPVGEYSGTVSFVNTSNGQGNTTRDVFLTVVPAGVIEVQPDETFFSAGPQGGPFTPPSKTYTVSNTGGWPINWSVGWGVSWATISPTFGSLPAGATTNVTVTITGTSLSSGTYSNAVRFFNNTNSRGNTQRPVVLTVGPTPGTLSVSPAGGLSSSGYQGGPFSPASQVYTLSNTGSASLNWQASKSTTWVSVSLSAGSLNPGASTTVTVSINTNANGLAGGSYSDTVSFVNTTTGIGNTTRPVSLTVTPVTLNAPGSLTATQITGPAVRLNWTDTSTNEGGFAIERAVKSGSSWGAFSQIGAAGANATTFTDSGVSKKKSYRYRVRAFQGTSFGPYSAVVEITVN